MKKKILLFSMTAIFASMSMQAQLFNNTLDNWLMKTSSLAAFPPVISAETHTYNDPQYWSTSNQATTNTALGNAAYVTQDTIVRYEGYSSARLESNEITIPLVGTILVPGLLVNGDFVINPADFATGGLDPFAVPGTGSAVPVGPKPAKLVGYFNYAAAGGDSCEIVAALVDASRTEVARAVFTYSGTTSGFVYFEAPFVYTSCATPDTLIIIASSSPFSSGVGSGVDGSVLWVDSFGISTSPAVNIPPIAVDDNITTLKNTPVTTTTLLSNDSDCEGTTLSVTSVSVAPLHGSTTVAGNNVTYVPALNYFGADQYTYTVQDAGGASSTAIVNITVNDNVGINEVNQSVVKMFPNPANQNFVFSTNNANASSYKMTDVAGNIVLTGNVSNGENRVDVSALANGFYILNLCDGQTIVSTSKINVQH